MRTFTPLRQFAIFLLLTLAAGTLLAAGDQPAAGPEAASPSAPVAATSRPADYTWPQQRTVDGLTVVIHAPQIRAWPDFKRFEALVAVEVTAPGETTAHYGTATVSGATEIDMKARLVRVRAPKVESVQFTGSAPDTHREAVMHATHSGLDVPLDLFLAYLADDVLSEPPPPGFNPKPPPIAVRSKPTVLLFVNGEPVPEAVTGTQLERIANANWPLFRSKADKPAWYLLEQDRWLTSSKLEKGWKAAKKLPDDFNRLPDEPQYAVAKKAVPLVKSERTLPAVLFADKPTELIVTDGKPKLEGIAWAGKLEYTTNTDSPLFRLDKTWYFLVAGRWFTTANLHKGPWAWTAQLPEAFANIPEDHPMAAVRASVPGTPEARMAALEAMLPTTVSAQKNAAPPVEVTYGGEPIFELIPGTQVSRAANSGFDVLKYQQDYYLLYAGIWYTAAAPTGPWSATGNVPTAIYLIPPESPSYPVTQVTVVESSDDNVVYTYPASYSSNTYVVYGVPWYGTGWYYEPYYWYPYYYPYPPSYGYGSWYNPATGGYGSRSVWYGPYGGYSYNQGYNPNTGRYGYVETAWDGDEWASYGETYNPRTGVGTETERHYDEDKNRSEMQRNIGRGDQWMQTNRETDFDDNTIEVERKTGSGASSEMTRKLEDGTLSSSGTIETGDGRTYSVSGEATREGGQTTITGEGGSADITTKREGGQSVSTIEGSGGGQGISVSGEGPGRTTIGQSGSGDIYAGHNGNVYKKSGDGWQYYENGSWQQVDVPERQQQAPRMQEEVIRPSSTDRARPEMGPNPPNAGDRQRSSSMDTRRQLDRDYSARQRSARQYDMRSGGFNRGSFGGGMRSSGGLRGRR